MGRQALHPSSPAAASALAVASSEEEGLHTRPLPHTYGEYFCVVAVFIGGGRIGTLPSSSQWRGVLRRGRDRPSSSQCRYVRRLHVGCAVQVVRGLDQAGLLTVGALRRYLSLGWGSVCTRVQSELDGTLCDTMQRMCEAGVPCYGWVAGGPTVWVSVYPRVVLGSSCCEVLHPFAV